MKIGLLGGSFNPIHNGHIYLAETVCKELELDKLIFIPSNIPPHKSNAEYVSGQHRYNMCLLATEQNEKFSVSKFELERNSTSYSFYTVEHYKELFHESKLYFIMGSDMLLSFDSWYRYADILKMCSLAVVSREYDDMEELEEKREFLGKYGEIILLKSPPIPMSSTKIREMIKNNANYSCNLSKKVVKYIMMNDLYEN